MLHFSSNDNDHQTGALENFIWTKKKPETDLMLMTPVGEEGPLWPLQWRFNYTLSLGKVMSAVTGVKWGHRPKAKFGFVL